MAKATKPKKERSKTYDQPLAVKGSFMDIITASVKDAENKTAAKKTQGSENVTDQGGLTAKKKAE